jgi:hypothetical protein
VVAEVDRWLPDDVSRLPDDEALAAVSIKERRFVGPK